MDDVEERVKQKPRIHIGDTPPSHFVLSLKMFLELGFLLLF